MTPETSYTLPRPCRSPTARSRSRTRAGTVTMSVAEILAYSSNVGAATIGLQLGAEKYSRWIRPLRLRPPTGVEFPGEEQGIVLPLDEYSGSTMGNLPIGQGISVTPMQMVAGYTAIANGGCSSRRG